MFESPRSNPSISDGFIGTGITPSRAQVESTIDINNAYIENIQSKLKRLTGNDNITAEDMFGT